MKKTKRKNVEGILGLFLIINEILAMSILLKVTSHISTEAAHPIKATLESTSEVNEIIEDYDESVAIDSSSLFDEADIILLAGVMEAEAPYTYLKTRARIGAIILNRSLSKVFEEETIYEIVHNGDYQTVNEGAIPDTPSQENIELATYLVNTFEGDEWNEFCLSIAITGKTVFEANSSEDMTGYAVKILDEYGQTQYYEWHLCYWESIHDTSDEDKYSEIHNETYYVDIE